ncbi:alpha-(1-_3)-arabinofuranosyltransferase family protein [Nocardioides hwasunensis]
MTSAGTRFRWRLVAVCVLLLGVAMTQSPGLLVADTKLDLAIAPLDFLGRAAHLWDGQGAFGQLQNQAYGYLWPMGPFFALGSLLDVPGWVVQRLWMALVLSVAFVGAARVARALGVRSDLACILGGLAFALSPRMLTVIGPSSIEVWPMALTPWVLLPLVIGAERGSARRAAALSALAIAMVGGVNAAATAAVLPLGAIWLLIRTPGARRRTMMIWWPIFTLVATLWWLVPLFLLGAYSPPFLDFIESAGITTIPTNLADSLRGTSNWVPYVDGSSRAGNDLIRQPYLALNSAFVLVAGVVGLVLRRTPHRLFLVSGLVVGLFLVSMGHLGTVQGWFAPSIQELLDGALAPLRNVHKFDPIVRLPLVIGVAWLVDWLVELARDSRLGRPERANFRFLAGLVAFAVLAAATPAAAGHITPSGGFDDVPDYWAQTAEWLAEQQDSGVALLVPGTMFGSYVWGEPRDEPFQSLASTPWAVRNAVPLTPAGNIRMLDAVEERFAQGHGSAGLTDYMRRAGISHLVVRNDLSRGDDHPDPVLVHQAIEESPGLELETTFGPAVGGGAHVDGDLGRALINGGWQNDYAAIEVYSVDDLAAPASATDEAPVVVGGPEDLLDLTDLGVIGDDVPTRLAADVGDGAATDDASVVLTDGNQSVVRHFGRIHDATSSVRTRAQAQDPQETVPDYLLPDPARWSTFAEYDGVVGVTASSSLAQAGAAPAQPGRLAYAAIDGQPSTSWQSAQVPDDAHWWQVDLEEGVALTSIEVTGAGLGDQEVTVSTDDWTSDRVLLAPDTPTRILVDDASSPFVRITDASGRTSTPLALAEVEIPGVSAARPLRLPAPPAGAGTPDAVVLRAIGDARSGCASVDLDVRCVQGREGSPEEPLDLDRIVTLPGSATYDADLRVRAVPGDALQDLLQQGAFVGVDASSTGVPDARGSALAAIDGNDGTTWTAALSDVRPTISLRWLRPQTLRELRIRVARDTAARAPQTLDLRWPKGRRSIELDEDGRAEFPTIRTDQLVLEVGESEPVTSVDFDGATSAVPVGVTELTFAGADGLPELVGDQPLDLPCGSGPDVELDGDTLSTAVRATAIELYEGETVPAELCPEGPVTLGSGDNRITVRASDAFAPDSLVLSTGTLPLGVSTAVAGSSDGAGRAEYGDAPAGSLLAGRENANPGWRATQSGADLSSVVVDGWRQGWRTSGSASAVEAHFGPGSGYRIALFTGLLTALALLGLVLLARRWWSRDAGLLPVNERGLPRLVALVLVPVAGLLLAGRWGLVVAMLAGVIVWTVHRTSDAVARGLVALLVFPAIAIYAFEPWGGLGSWAGGRAWPSYLVVAVVSGLVVLVATDSCRRNLPWRRSAGISTTR